jgi:hypothetical protein
MTDTVSNPPTLVPGRRESMGRQYRVTNDTASHPAGNTNHDGVPPLVMEQKAFLRLQAPTASSSSQDGPSPDIHMLAREVAAVMMQNTLDTSAGEGSRSTSDDAVLAPPSYANHR